MAELTNEQFKAQLVQWKSIMTENGLKVDGGRPIPDKFFHVFLGVSYSVLKMMVCGKSSLRKVQPYTAKTVHFINRLEKDVFLAEAKFAIKEYDNLYC